MDDIQLILKIPKESKKLFDKNIKIIKKDKNISSYTSFSTVDNYIIYTIFFKNVYSIYALGYNVAVDQNK